MYISKNNKKATKITNRTATYKIYIYSFYIHMCETYQLSHRYFDCL